MQIIESYSFEYNESIDSAVNGYFLLGKISKEHIEYFRFLDFSDFKTIDLENRSWQWNKTL